MGTKQYIHRWWVPRNLRKSRWVPPWNADCPEFTGFRLTWTASIQIAPSPIAHNWTISIARPWLPTQLGDSDCPKLLQFRLSRIRLPLFRIDLNPNTRIILIPFAPMPLPWISLCRFHRIAPIPIAPIPNCSESHCSDTDCPKLSRIRLPRSPYRIRMSILAPAPAGVTVKQHTTKFDRCWTGVCFYS